MRGPGRFWPVDRRLSAAFGISLIGIVLFSGWRVHTIAPLAMTIGQTTLVRPTEADPARLARLDQHEAVHRRQFRRAGFLRFLVLYAFDRQQRLDWEAEAYLAVFCSQPVHREPLPEAMNRLAARLQSYWMVRPVSRREARRHLLRTLVRRARCGESRIARSAAPASTLPAARP